MQLKRHGGIEVIKQESIRQNGVTDLEDFLEKINLGYFDAENNFVYAEEEVMDNNLMKYKGLTNGKDVILDISASPDGKARIVLGSPATAEEPTIRSAVYLADIVQSSEKTILLKLHRKNSTWSRTSWFFKAEPFYNQRTQPRRGFTYKRGIPVSGKVLLFNEAKKCYSWYKYSELYNYGYFYVFALNKVYTPEMFNKYYIVDTNI